jgi:peptidoglycan/LPS O-acetylase OafA/YrhL
MSQNESRIPSLDGVRAIAIGLVCLGHLTWNQRLLGPNGQYLKLGDIGVRIFFVLSGYLITAILLRELEHTGTLSLRRFYFRRTLRIFPAFYTFVAVMIVSNSLWWAHLYHGSPLPSLSYTADYFVPAKRVFGHTWSLAVEEQFYLLWPAALVLLGRRRGLWFAGLVLLVCPFMRVVSFVLMARHAEIASLLQNPQFRFDTQADALATGCLLAGFRVSLRGQAWYRKLQASRAFALLPILGLTVTLVGRQQLGLLYAAYLIVGYAVTNVAIALSLDWCLTHPVGIIGRFLNAAPIVTVGVLSYSIYLWQEPFLYVGRSAWWQVPPLNLGLALLAATASHVLVERPFLRLRARWEPRLFSKRSTTPDPRQTAAGQVLPLGVGQDRVLV